MKKLLLALLIFGAIGIFNSLEAQTFQGGQINLQGRTRTVYFFIDQMDTQSELVIVKNYLQEFKGKIEQVSIDLNTQMATLEVQNINDNDIVEVILQKGFNAYEKDALPPAGFKYVYNPDGTWKLKQL